MTVRGVVLASSAQFVARLAQCFHQVPALILEFDDPRLQNFANVVGARAVENLCGDRRDGCDFFLMPAAAGPRFVEPLLALVVFPLHRGEGVAAHDASPKER